MPFPTEVTVSFDKSKSQPTITLSVRGDIAPTKYTVAVSSLDDPKTFVTLFSGTKLDSPQTLKGPTVATVADLNGRKIKWLIGLTNPTNPTAEFGLDVTCKQDGVVCPNATSASGNLQDGVELANGLFDCTVS